MPTLLSNPAERKNRARKPRTLLQKIPDENQSKYQKEVTVTCKVTVTFTFTAPLVDHKERRVRNMIE